MKQFLQLVPLFSFVVSCLCLPHAAHAEDLIDQFELRGVFMAGNECTLSIFDRSSGGSFWISENQSRHLLTLLSFDSDDRVAKLSYAGQDFYLSLSESEEFVVKVVSNIGSSGGNGAYENAVKVAAAYIKENPDADLLDAPISGSVRSTLMKSRFASQTMKSGRSTSFLAQAVNSSSGEGGDGDVESLVKAPKTNPEIKYYADFERSVRLEVRRLIRETILSGPSV